MPMAANNQLTKQQVQAYLSRVDIQTPLEAALNAAVNAQAEDPIVFFADYFAEKAGRTKAPPAAAAVSAERAQTAFVFTKPHANTEAVRNLVRRKFSDVGIEIVSEGDLDGPTIDANQHIDQHYYAIASKATLLHPSELNAPKAKFTEKFGEDWDALVAGGKLLNAKDACTKLGISAPELYTAWLASQDAGNCLKLGGGFYVAPVEVAGHEKMYTLNAFFMSMRGKFTAPDASIHFYVVRFDPATLAWADFRGAVLGPTDPAKAPASSLRGMLAADWQALGLAAAPNTSDNGVHASASPFEGLAERMNWLKLDVADDELARRLIDAGVSAEMIKEWSVDPQVALPGGGKGSLFDQLEDLDIGPCVAKAAELARAGTKLQILLQEDLTIRGGAQLWLMNCGSRLQASGHQVTFLLPSDSLIRDDCAAIDGAGVATYDREAIAESPDEFRSQFTELLRPAHVCVTLVRQKRGGFQNVGFMGECIAAAGLKTFLIAKTGTPDPSYEKSFYGGPLLESGQCCVITIAEYTKEFIVDKMGVPAELITNVYNGTDTAKFKRTPEMAAEALVRYPLVDGAFVVGCIGSFEERKGQSVLLRAAKKLLDDGRVPNVHCLFVGEGPDKEMLLGLIDELGIGAHATICDFTKEPFYVFERCDVVALPSIGKEGLPNVLLEALAMEKPCVATRSYGSPEVVVDGKTGYCFPSGDVDALADALAQIAKTDDVTRAAMAAAGKALVFSEHDKSVQFEKILRIIQEKAAAAMM